jgi:hypothetical protein
MSVWQAKPWLTLMTLLESVPDYYVKHAKNEIVATFG